jgi:hypothetical protein
MGVVVDVVEADVVDVVWDVVEFVEVDVVDEEAADEVDELDVVEEATDDEDEVDDDDEVEAALLFVLSTIWNTGLEIWYSRCAGSSPNATKRNTQVVSLSSSSAGTITVHGKLWVEDTSKFAIEGHLVRILPFASVVDV